MELRGCQVVDVSDACDDLGVPAVRTGALVPMWSGCPSLTGTVATITMGAATSPAADPMPDLLRALAAMAGSVVLIDVGAGSGLQCWGGFLTVAAQRSGVLGAIIEGAVRDVEALARSGFPVYARGVYPGRIRGRLRVVDTGAMVPVANGVVGPTHVVLADRDGVIFVPEAAAPQVAALARQRAASEREELARLLAAPL
jgi:4-hydroxy-4-methyl-2-oxoglutarate aldolase